MATIRFYNPDDNINDPIADPYGFLDIGTATAEADLLGLASGGVVGIGNFSSTTISGRIFSATGVQTGTVSGISGTNGAIGQLNDGNIVIASQDSDSILFKIVSSTNGATAVDTVDLNLVNSSNADVVGLSDGGFFIAYQTRVGGNNNDIVFAIGGNDGNGISQTAIDSTLANDTGVSIAKLDGDNVAMAWTRTIGAQTEIW